MYTISVIIPNYNGKQLLEANLPFVIKLQDKYHSIKEIIIVDDKSADQSVSYIRENFPDISLIEKNHNTGFIETVNIGVGKAKGELLLLLNTDVRPNSDIIDKLTPHFNDQKVFAVGCLDKSIEKEEVIERGRGIGYFTAGFLLHQKGNNDKHNTLWVSGGSGMYRKSIWDKLGGLDPVYKPFYWEDIDLSYRALKAGYCLIFEREAQVVHFHEKGTIKNQFTGSQIKEISLRNQILFVWKNISDVRFIFEHLINLPVAIISAVLRTDMIFLKAVLKALLRLPVVLIHRYKQNKLWIKSDRDILNEFKGELS